MFVTPINFVSMFRLVPVFEWEQVEPAEETPPPPTCESADGASVDPQAGPEHSPAELRLVFKGFQWRPGLEALNFPRPFWADVSVEAPQETSGLDADEQRRAREQDQARKPKPEVKEQPRPWLDPTYNNTPTPESPE